MVRWAMVMVAWARLVSDYHRAGVHRTIKLTEALIAATAIEHGLPVVTQDEDYSRIAQAHAALQVAMV
jgi:predicted nucleic acid-binding protein